MRFLEILTQNLRFHAAMKLAMKYRQVLMNHSIQKSNGMPFNMVQLSNCSGDQTLHRQVLGSDAKATWAASLLGSWDATGGA